MVLRLSSGAACIRGPSIDPGHLKGPVVYAFAHTFLPTTERLSTSHVAAARYRLAMIQVQLDSAIQAANLALDGRREKQVASRFASIELQRLNTPEPSSRRYIAWEFAAVSAIGFCACLSVIALWFL